MKILSIILCKTGDILAALPMLYAESATERPALMVARKYAPLLEGCSWLDVVPFDGQAHELARAVEHAKTLAESVRCLTIAGPQAEVLEHTFIANGQKQAATDSHAKEPWKLAGQLHRWMDSPPLVFDNRDAKREKALWNEYEPSRKLILVAAGGQTSPFPHKAVLMELLKGRFKKPFQIVDLSAIKAERFYDFLGLYERAHCLVACDSAHLHLANACRGLPVCALIQDVPQLWNGSPWRSNHIFHCRYKDFARRGVEMLDAMQRIKSPGTFFRDRVEGVPLFIHAWSHYELQKGWVEANRTWQREYKTGSWIAAASEVGAFGRDSHYSAVRDPRRFPFVHDVIKLACARAKMDDVIVLTRADVALVDGATALIKSPSWAHAMNWTEKGLEHSPSIGLWAFTKSFYFTHAGELPGLILGTDVHAPRILKEWIVKHGGSEIKNIAYRKAVK